MEIFLYLDVVRLNIGWVWKKFPVDIFGWVWYTKIVKRTKIKHFERT